MPRTEAAIEKELHRLQKQEEAIRDEKRRLTAERDALITERTVRETTGNLSDAQVDALIRLRGLKVVGATKGGK